MSGTVTDTTTTPAISDRLTAARDEVDELEELLAAARRRRNELIVVAHDDEGMGYKTIARHAGVSKTLVIGVLART